MIVGLVDMFGFAGFLVAGDTTATARSILTGELVYRLGILTDPWRSGSRPRRGLLSC